MTSGKVTAIAIASLVFSQIAAAHVSFASITPVANSNVIATLVVPHGCNGEQDDTYKVELTIPSGFTTVRAADSTLGEATVEKDGNGNVTKVTWTKPATATKRGDTSLYQLALRGKVANTPFGRLEFPAKQYCRNTSDVESPDSPVSWDGANVPTLRIYPARVPGWNQYTIPDGISLDAAGIKSYFSDAQVVWKGKAVYSANPNVTTLVGKDASLSTLTTLNAGDVVWVKY